jgi:hypothetical protein
MGTDRRTAMSDAPASGCVVDFMRLHMALFGWAPNRRCGIVGRWNLKGELIPKLALVHIRYSSRLLGPVLDFSDM